MEIEKPFLRGTPGRLTHEKKIKYALTMLKLRNDYELAGETIPRSLSYQSIANKVGVFSATTIRNWNLHDMTPEGLSDRARLKAPDTKFSQDEEEVIVGWIIYRDITMMSTTTEKFRYLVFNYFGRVVSPSFITKFMKKWNLSLKLVGNAHHDEAVNRENVIQESTEWLDSLELFMCKYNVPFDRLFAIDKTYLFTAPWHKYVRHIGPSGSVKSRKLTCDRGAGHEIWTTLRSNGVRGTFYVRTSDPKLAQSEIFDIDDGGYLSYVPILKDEKTKKNISPGERSTLSYLYYMIEISREFHSGDVLIFDGESALSTPNVQRYLFDHDIHPFVLPSIHHQLLNPCDNSFHSLFKLRYYRLISNMNGEAIDPVEKLRLARQCYYDISDESVEAMFKRCGLIPSGESKRSIVSRLMSESISTLNRNQKEHLRCLVAFLKWCRANELAEELCPIPIDASTIV